MTKRIELPIVAAVSAALLLLSACDTADNSSWTAQGNTRFCTDQNGQRVPDDQCQRPGTGTSFYTWYYLSRGGYVPRIGGLAYGGSRIPMSGTTYEPSASSFAHAAPSSVVRGGFGGSAGEAGAGE